MRQLPQGGKIPRRVDEGGLGDPEPKQKYLSACKKGERRAGMFAN